MKEIAKYILDYIQMNTPAGIPKKTKYTPVEHETPKLLNNMMQEERDSVLVEGVITAEDVINWQKELKDYNFLA